MAARPWAQAPPVRLGGALRSASPSTRQRSRSAARCCADCDVGDRHSKALADKCIRAASPPGLLVSLMMMCAAFLSFYYSRTAVYGYLGIELSSSLPLSF